MNPCRLNIATCALVLGAGLFAPHSSAFASTGSAPALAISTFGTDADNWTVTGDIATTPLFVPSGGNPGGYVSTTDQASGDTWHWSAPAKFLGDKSAAFGGSLRFDLRQDPDDSQFLDADVILEGASLRLMIRNPYPPRTIWTSYAVVLDPLAGWLKDDGTGLPPTEADMRAVLATLTAIRIRGEHQLGDDTGDLDNVRLEGPGTPPWQRVPGTTSIYLAGRDDVVVPPFGSDLSAFPLGRNCTELPCDAFLLEQFPPVYPASGDMRFSFRAAGSVDYYGDPNGKIGPDGTPQTESLISPLGGISGFLGPHGALVGVFLGPGNPRDDTPPDDLPFGTSFSTLNPALGQVFFIGDGLSGTGTGELQTFVAPAGATRLFLGIADAGSFAGQPGWYDDNYGHFWVQINQFRVYVPVVARR